MKVLCAAFIAMIFSLGIAADVEIAEERRLFANPPDDCRIMMRWWWFGPSVAKPELENEMKLMKEGGIGGFEVQPVYPVALDDTVTGIKNVPYLSDEFLEALRFASDKAYELGLRMDLTLGSGWPFGGAQVPVRDAAGKLRIVRIRVPEGARRLPVPAIDSGEKLLAAFLRFTDSTIAGGEIRELTEFKNGAVALPLGLQHSGEALFFISSRSGMMVKRSAVGAEGFVLNHYDRTAVESYLNNVGDRLLQALRPRPPHAVFCDSLEVYESDWTEDFLEEFQKRRGYDLKPYLPALALDVDPRSAAISCDWGRTLTELFNERFMIPLHAWSQKNNTLFRVQGYGIPPASIASNAHADVSEGEGTQWKKVSASRWAASANHLFGRTVTSAETWTWLHSPVFRATPLDMKAEANLHFLQGVNQLIGHGWPYTAKNVEYPGWRFYAAGVFNEINPWWIVMPEVTRYLQRASYLLRQGQPANSIAFYLPISDAYASFKPGRANLYEGVRDRVGPNAIAGVLEAGLNLDFFDDEVLRQIGKIEGDTLKLGPNRYRAVVLPNVERIPLGTWRSLAEFARSGGRLIATKRLPALSPGFAAANSETAAIRQISQNLFSSSENAVLIEDEKTQLTPALRKMVGFDVKFEPETTEIGLVHRRTDEADIYFLANTSNIRQTVKASFAVTRMQAEWWDPMSGRITPAGKIVRQGGITSVELDLEPYGSRFLVFSDEQRPAALVAPKTSESVLLDLSEGWLVTFGTKGPTKRMERLSSWIEDEATRDFSGVAVYEKALPVPESMLEPGTVLQLDLGAGQAVKESSVQSNGMRAWFEGPVREAAVIYVNGQRAGSVWCPPYNVDLTGLLTRGENRIRILVANTAVNYIAGRSLPDYRLLNLRYGKRFDPQDMDKIHPVDSGLLGTIRLIKKNATNSRN
jgi:hypothetical protein